MLTPTCRSAHPCSLFARILINASLNGSRNSAHGIPRPLHAGENATLCFLEFAGVRVQGQIRSRHDVRHCPSIAAFGVQNACPAQANWRITVPSEASIPAGIPPCGPSWTRRNNMSNVMHWDQTRALRKTRPRARRRCMLVLRLSITSKTSATASNAKRTLSIAICLLFAHTFWSATPAHDRLSNFGRSEWSRKHFRMFQQDTSPTKEE